MHHKIKPDLQAISFQISKECGGPKSLAMLSKFSKILCSSSAATLLEIFLQVRLKKSSQVQSLRNSEVPNKRVYSFRYHGLYSQKFELFSSHFSNSKD